MACYAHGLADDVYGPEAKPLALEPLERAMEFRLQPIAALARERCCRTADRFNAVERYRHEQRVMDATRFDLPLEQRPILPPPAL